MPSILTFHRLPTVMARTGLSRATIYRLAAIGEFPKPCKLASRTSAWSSDEIEQWMAERIQGRDSGNTQGSGS